MQYVYSIIYENDQIYNMWDDDTVSEIICTFHNHREAKEFMKQHGMDKDPHYTIKQYPAEVPF